MRSGVFVSMMFLAGGALAQENRGPTGVGPSDVPSVVAADEATAAAPEQGFHLAYGAALTSNYISDGATQSNDNPAVQGYVEGTYGVFYGGAWASTVDFPDDPDYGEDSFELDLYAGIRPTIGTFDLDLAYYRYLYNKSGDCCGEFQFVVSHAVGEGGALSAEFDYDPETDGQWGQLGGSIEFAEVWSASFSIGTDFGSDAEEGDPDKVAVDAGITRSILEKAWIDLRYYDSNYDPETVVATLGIDF